MSFASSLPGSYLAIQPSAPANDTSNIGHFSPPTTSNESNGKNTGRVSAITPMQTLSDLSYRAALFQNIIASAHYQQSRYTLAIKHYRRGIELLVQRERCTASGSDVECLAVAAEMCKHISHIEMEHGDRLLRMTSTTVNCRHSHRQPIGVNSTQQEERARRQRHNRATRRRESIILTEERGLCLLRNDGSLSEPLRCGLSSPIKRPTCDADLSLISAIIMHNLALCHSGIANYQVSNELIRMSRETAKISLIDTSSTAGTNSANQGTRESFATIPTCNIVSLHVFYVDRINDSLDQFEHQLTAEIEASIANQNIMDMVLAGANGSAAAG